MDKCKTKAIQTGFGTFRHNQAYPGITQAYSKPCVTLIYLEPWYIQNPNIFKIRIIFRTLEYSKSKAYSDICDEALCENSLRKIVSQCKFDAFSISWNKYYEVFTLEVAPLCKKNYSARECGGPWIFDIPTFK